MDSHLLQNILQQIELMPYQCLIELTHFPDNIYLFKVNNRNIKKNCKIFSKLTKKHQTDVNDVWYFDY